MAGEIKKADLVKRILAIIIDSVITWLPSFIPFVGGLIGAVYMLTKDAIVAHVTKNEEWRGASVGKKLMGLKVLTAGGQDIDLTVSVKRNLPFVVGPILMVIPFLGWIAAAVLAPVIGLIESVLVLVDPAGRRLGDRFAGTVVVDTAPSTRDKPAA